MSIKPGGFTEAGISITDPEIWIDFLQKVGGYQEIWRGESAGPLKKMWGIDSGNHVMEYLMAAPGADSGHIRLFRFDGTGQIEIRPQAQIQDAGGIFDLDIRVPAVLPLVDPLKQIGWRDFSRPVDWPFGELQVREWLATGPDSVVFALIERLSPPLAGFEGLTGFSHVFNSSQVVSDMDRSIRFYQSLGFQKILHHQGPLAGQGGEVLGLCAQDAPVTPVELVILQPDGVLDGSVELVAIEGVEGRDLSARARPYNLGLNLLRFPVRGLQAYAGQLEEMGLRPADTPVFKTRIEPFGETGIIAIQTPDGAWLEFYEAF